MVFFISDFGQNLLRYHSSSHWYDDRFLPTHILSNSSGYYLGKNDEPAWIILDLVKKTTFNAIILKNSFNGGDRSTLTFRFESFMKLQMELAHSLHT